MLTFGVMIPKISRGLRAESFIELIGGVSRPGEISEICFSTFFFTALNALFRTYMMSPTSLIVSIRTIMCSSSASSAGVDYPSNLLQFNVFASQDAGAHVVVVLDCFDSGVEHRSPSFFELKANSSNSFSESRPAAWRRDSVLFRHRSFHLRKTSQSMEDSICKKYQLQGVKNWIRCKNCLRRISGLADNSVFDEWQILSARNIF